VVEFGGVKESLVDALDAAEDGHDGCLADQMGQGDDVAAGATVEVVGEGRRLPGLRLDHGLHPPIRDDHPR
jgi:hypothetical protein